MGAERCGAKTRTGGTCAKPAGWGTPNVTGRCKLHGGNTPNHLIAAQRTQAEAAVATYGLPIEIEPHDALLQELYRTAGHVAWLQALIAGFESKDELKQYAPGGTAKTEDGDDYALLWEKPAIWVELYHRERRHLADVAKTCISVGIEERRVRIVEQAGEQIAGVLRRFAAALGLALDEPRVQQAARRALLAEAGVVESDATEVGA